MNPVEGLKVIDFSRVMAGPLAGQTLADMGADVVKVEPPGGDEARFWAPMDRDIGTTYLACNRGKRDIVVDLKSADGQRLAASLAASADVVIENFTPGTTRRLGIDPETLRNANPRLIYCSISGFGDNGPLRNARAYDPVLQAFCGVMGMTTDPEGGPGKVPFPAIDMSTAQHAVSGILAALYRREKTGVGALVEVSLLDSALALMALNFQNFWAVGEPRKASIRNRLKVPYQVFETADEPLMLCVGNEAMWPRLCEALGRADLAADPRFATNEARVARFEETEALVQDLLRARGAQEWTRLLGEVGVPSSPVQTIAQVLLHAQTMARQVVLPPETAAGARSIGGVAMPIKFDGSRIGATSLPPELGSHTREVLLEQGCSDGEIAQLLNSGVIA